VTEDEVVRMLADLPDVVTVMASRENDAPEIAWGDSFFFYDPDGTSDQRHPFATIVTKDYTGFDTSSDLDRPGVYRLNLEVGREVFERLFGFPPAVFADQAEKFDYATLDHVIPHPVYARQGWVSVLVPDAHTEDQVRDLASEAYRRARGRYRPKR
jgi:hypothetical protein